MNLLHCLFAYCMNKPSRTFLLLDLNPNFFSEWLMVSGMSKKLIVASETREQARKVLEILRENRIGLTSVQIAHALGGRMRRDLLRRLQKEGKVKQARGLLPDGRIAILYALNMSKS